MEQVTVRVPASTSNLGPGYDCLGVALRLYNDVTVYRAAGERRSEMVVTAAAKFFAGAKMRPFAFSCAVAGAVPSSRGLGSSVTVRLGIILGLNALTQRPLSRAQCFDLCAGLEGHPDNAAPAAFGGFNVISRNVRQRFPVSSQLRFVLLVPPFEVRTQAARKLLPEKVAHASAVANCANACAITAAFASGEYEQLRGVFADYLHQPFRKPLIPFFDDVVAAAESSGALGAFLSGSGSTIAAVVLGDVGEIPRAMSSAAGLIGARTIVASADNRGARVLPNRR